jgi:hypothetical protein
LFKQYARIDKFYQLWATMSPYSCFTQFKKLYRQVIQLSCKEKKALGCMFVPVFLGYSL